MRDGELFDSEGVLVQLRAKSARMVAVLLENPGHIFSKDDLARNVWPGLIATDESISQCISDIRKTLGDQDHNIVETFPKRGYRINAALIPPSPVGRPGWRKPRLTLISGIATFFLMLLVLVVTQVIWSPETADESAATEKPPREAIAVLPFESVNGTSNDAYLSTGLAEDLIIQLSDLSALRVVPGARSFAMGSNVSSPTDAAAELDARYLVYGRIQYDQKMLKVSVQLIDSREDINVWAGHYDVPRDDLLTYHDAVLGTLTQAMSLALTERDARRINERETTSALAFDEILKGRAAVSQFTPQGNLAAEKHFRTAIGYDPNYARAYAQLAATYAIRLENDWTVLDVADEEKAMFFAKKAIELDPDLWLAQYAMGRIFTVGTNYDLVLAERHLRSAMSINPENDDARAYLAAVKNFSGDANQGLSIIEAVLAAHPSPPFWYYLTQGNLLMNLERYGEAAVVLDKCLEQMPTSPYCLRYQIANFGLLGQIEDAEWATAEYESLGHTLSIDAIIEVELNRNPDDLRRFRAGLHKAGLQ